MILDDVVPAARQAWLEKVVGATVEDDVQETLILRAWVGWWSIGGGSLVPDFTSSFFADNV